MKKLVLLAALVCLPLGLAAQSVVNPSGSPNAPFLNQSVTIAPGTWVGTGGTPTAACDTGDGYVCTVGSGVVLVHMGTTPGANFTPVVSLSWTTPLVNPPVCQAWFGFNTTSNPAFVAHILYPNSTASSKTGIALNDSSGTGTASLSYLLFYECL